MIKVRSAAILAAIALLLVILGAVANAPHSSLPTARPCAGDCSCLRSHSQTFGPSPPISKPTWVSRPSSSSTRS